MVCLHVDHECQGQVSLDESRPSVSVPAACMKMLVPGDGLPASVSCLSRTGPALLPVMMRHDIHCWHCLLILLLQIYTCMDHFALRAKPLPALSAVIQDSMSFFCSHALWLGCSHHHQGRARSLNVQSDAFLIMVNQSSSSKYSSTVQ